MLSLLPPYQLESSLVTLAEVDFTKRWVQTVTSDHGALSDDAWLDGWLGTALPFSFQYSARGSGAVLPQWQFHKSISKAQTHTEQCKSIWSDENSGLRVIWHLKRFLDYPAVEWLLEFENKGTVDTPIIEDIQALDLRLNHPKQGQPYIIHGANGGRSLPDDMMPFSRQLPSAEGENEMTLGGEHPSSNRHLPFFNLETPEDQGVIIGVGWSGNWSARLEVDGSELRARVGLKESHFALRPGEKIRTPRILLLFWGGKPLHGQNMLRQLLHKHYAPPLPDKPLVSVNACFTHHGRGGFLHQATEKEVLALVQPFIKIGAELFIIDAGWYDGEPWHEWQGNWQFSRKKYPRGFRPISEPLARANVAFGLWFASESVSATAPLSREHPEWVRNGTLRMELPEAREWFLTQVDHLIENEMMNCYRQDGSGSYGHEPDDRKGITESQHIAGLYTLWDTLIKRHPNLIMEGCSGGGRRIDLETLSRFHWHQKSDRWYDSESDQCSLYGANLFLPGGVINIPTEATDDYGAWSSFAGQFCPGWHPLDEDFPMELAELQVQRYKRIRSLLSGDFYPLTPCSLEEEWIGYQFHRVDLDKGFALIFRRPTSRSVVPPVSDALNIRLRGLDPERRYRVHFERSSRDDVLTGDTLAKGLEVTITGQKGAEMITYWFDR